MRTSPHSKFNNIVAVAQSDTVNQTAIIQELHLLASGTVVIIPAKDDGTAGTAYTLIIPATGFQVPYIVKIPVLRINDTNTTLTDAQMVGYN